MTCSQSNNSSHRDGTDSYVADCGRQQWRLARMCEVDPRRAPKVFRVLSRCSDTHLVELMCAWGRPGELTAVVTRLYPEYA